ncbi:MAG: hypothetical protein M1833_001236 [Piccolia ochrophora]|nr:MAG: hypothetical protein M1833_001236 [Piccolia ochrophora]
MTNPPALDTYAALVSTFSSFLTVAIHTILYERSIYPTDTFLSARKYNFPVRQNRHPKVCKWINDAVNAVEAELMKGSVARVAVVIYAPSTQPLERFMFDVSNFPSVPTSEALTPFEAPSESGDSPAPPVGANIVDLEEQFRGAMGRLAYCGSSLGSLPEGCSFTVCIELKDEGEAPIGHPQPWIPSQPTLQPRSQEDQSSRAGKAVGGAKTTPVRAVESGQFVLELWVEEAKAKEEISSRSSSTGA